jgi:hypothetical protein
MMSEKTNRKGGTLMKKILMPSVLLGLLGSGLLTHVFAQEAPLWRFEFDNDIVGESDDFFSAGWSLQRHGPASTS